MPSSSTPVAPVQNELVGLTDLVLTRAPTALNPTGVTVALPNVPLDPAWDFETLRGHLRDHGHALQPDESTTIHLAHAQNDLERAIRTLLPSPGFEANPGPYGTVLLDRLLDLRQQRLSMGAPFGLSAAAMDSLILLEAHGLKRAMAASTAESPVPKRRL